jgi:phage shock protein PspC (stress-responsive transcriptional regulator)
MNATTESAEADTTSAIDPETSVQTRQEPLRRPLQDRMLAGVAAGIARYLGVDVTVIRIVLAVLSVVGGAGIPIYLAGWLLIPEEGHDQSIATELIQSLQARSR